MAKFHKCKYVHLKLAEYHTGLWQMKAKLDISKKRVK